MLYEPSDTKWNYVLELKYQLQEAGHSVTVAPKTQVQLGMDVRRIARMIRSVTADAWIVIAGLQDVLKWFLEQPWKTFAFFGKHSSLPMAAISSDRCPALRQVIRQLADLGHRRIVLLGRSYTSFPNPGVEGRAFLDELQANGIQVGAYNLPMWEESAEGFRKCLDTLFAATPPTALVIDEVFMFVAAQQYLAGLGFLAPKDVSLVCMGHDQAFDWCHPSITHIRWENQTTARSAVRWAARVRLGKTDVRKRVTKAELVEGETVGRVTRRLKKR